MPVRDDLENRWDRVLRDFTRGSSVLFVEALEVLEGLASRGEDVRPRVGGV